MPIVTAGKRPRAFNRWLALAIVLLAPVAVVVALMAVFGAFGGRGPGPSVADMVGRPVRAAALGGDRVYLMTSQWRTYPSQRRRPAVGGLLIDVWAFDAGDGRPAWRRRLVDQRGGVNMGREILGAQGGVLWLLDGDRLVGLQLTDGEVLFDSTSLEAVNPRLKGLVPTEARYYRFDRGGLAFTAADGRAWRLTGDGAATAPAGDEPKEAAPGVTAPARIGGGNGTSAFYARGVTIGRRWLGLLHEREVELFRQTGSIGGVAPEQTPRMRLWSARVTQEQTFFGPKPKLVDFTPLPEGPEFLQPALLTANDTHDTPIFALKPDSVFVLHRDRLGAEGTLRLSRVAGPAGKVLWTAELPVQALEAVMPGEKSVVLIGRRDEEPLWRRPNDRRTESVNQLVSVDLATGRMGVYGFRVRPGKAGEIPESSTRLP